MCDESTLTRLSSDRPIKSLKEDLLGRGHFAIGLANALISWTGTESLVLGLYGAWGSGKSSIKNMVLELLSKSARKPAVVEFNPWVWSGHDRLLMAFFDEVGQAVTGSAGLGDRSKELARTWKKYATRLALGGNALGYLKKATEVMGIPWVPMFLGLMAILYEIDLRQVESFVDLSALQGVLKPLMATSVSDEHAELLESHKTVIAAFSNAVRRRSEGRPDDDWRHDNL